MKQLVVILLIPFFMNAFQSKAEPLKTVEKVVPVTQVFMPETVEYGSEVYAVVNGLFPNGCYIYQRSQFQSFASTNEYQIKSYAMVSQGMCIMVIVPFSKQVKFGKLERGTYQFKFLNGDGTYILKKVVCNLISLKEIFIKSIVFGLVFLGGPYGSLAKNIPSNTLIGSWELFETELNEIRYPARDPDLKVYYIFYSDGTSILSWHNKRLELFCERKSNYLIDQQKIVEHVIWLNPKNTVTCASDPDMRMDIKTVTPFTIKNDILALQLQLSGQTLIYYWRKTLPEQPRYTLQPTNLY